MMLNSKFSIFTLVCGSVLLAGLLLGEQVEAGQGCPFEDGSCQEYCSQQGCNMGYCGHFAWIQCICRKCGDEWSWYDKVRYNPDKTVNQTELDSLKLNGTAPLILTTNGAQPTPIPKIPTETKAITVQPAAANQSTQAEKTSENNTKKQGATLTTLLIPDLSDTSGKLDLNDIPDENSEKFLDYLAKNHEKFVQTLASSSSKQTQEGDLDDSGSSSEEADDQAASTTSSSSEDEPIEIQISSSNNNRSQPQQQTTTTTTSTTTARPTAST